MSDKPESTHGYYRNSLTAWHADLMKQRRQLMARYAVMERAGHPDKRDQGYLLEINEGMLELVSSSLIGLAGRERRRTSLAETAPQTEKQG